LYKFGKKECPEESTGPAGKPLMDGNDRAVILLYLLLPQSQIRNKRNIKILFYGHGLYPD
jgi:hypothetical protein